MTNDDPCLDKAERQTLAITGQPLVLSLEHGVSPGARQLIWEEFFASRERGIDWATHLPWAGEATTLCASAALAEADTVLAALLVRPVSGTTTAMIGCVCVDPSFRGHGLSGRLIELSAAPLRRLGMTHLLLWTGKPAVYERVGFAVVAQERRLALRAPSPAPAASSVLTPWPTPDDSTGAGLPPFATAGWRVNGEAAQIVFADTPMGTALLDQAGPPDAVLDAMFAARSGDWTATLEAGHPLHQRAVARGVCIDEAPGPLTMYRTLGADTSPPAYVPPAFRI